MVVNDLQNRSLDVFQHHRELMFGVAYRVLGSVTEAEDVVQESWLRWSRTNTSQITDARSFLMRVSTRLAIDRLRRVKARREAYIGPWLPEPLVTGDDLADAAELAESVSMAMLVVLETLSPLERVVYVLREAFEFSFAEIADTLNRSEPAVRQLARRARGHVQEGRPRFQHDRTVRRQVTERFLAACLGGDLETLIDVLAPDVTLWGDGGGQRGTPRNPVLGSLKVAKLLAAIADRGPEQMEVRVTEINGGPAMVFSAAGSPFAVVALDIDPSSDRITDIWMVTNPDKLIHVG